MVYTEKDTNKMSWEEFGNVCDNLLKKIQESKVHFNIIVPILRNGMIPATVIANRLQILNIMPVQVKYEYATQSPNQRLPVLKPLDINIPDYPNILVVESNTFSGKSAEKVCELVKSIYPNSNIYYATVTRVFRKSINELSMYKEYFYGVMTDEELVATDEEKKKYNLREKITIYPWETVEYELEDINNAN